MDEVPAWEQREANRHYDPGREVFESPFLDGPLPRTEALRRRRRGEPLEYILGHVHLGGRELRCDPRALIPRTETETLARRFTGRLPDLPAGPIVDCGTGGGFLADWVARRCDRPVVAVDVDRPALQLARENRRVDGSYALLQADRLEAVGVGIAGVVANLPYVMRGDADLEDSVRRFEPDVALYCPGKGESFFLGFLERSTEVLRSGGEVWMELNPRWIQRLAPRIRTRSGWSRVHVHRDLRGANRFLQLVAA